MKAKTVWWIVGIVVVLGVLIYWGRMNDPSREWKRTLSAAGVECLPNGHVNLALHIHPILTITENGRHEIIPENIGIVSTCMAEVHTHDTGGIVHIESTEPGKTFTLAQFFSVWGKSFTREGFALTVTADGALVPEPASLVLKDSQDIRLSYLSITSP